MMHCLLPGSRELFGMKIPSGVGGEKSWLAIYVIFLSMVSCAPRISCGKPGLSFEKRK